MLQIRHKTVFQTQSNSNSNSMLSNSCLLIPAVYILSCGFYQFKANFTGDDGKLHYLSYLYNKSYRDIAKEIKTAFHTQL